MSGFSRFIYTLVGLSGLYLAFASPRFNRVTTNERMGDRRGATT
jgi:uncharacterized membrane protein YuzA (DUF378 family)